MAMFYNTIFYGSNLKDVFFQDSTIIDIKIDYNTILGPLSNLHFRNNVSPGSNFEIIKDINNNNYLIGPNANMSGLQFSNITFKVNLNRVNFSGCSLFTCTFDNNDVFIRYALYIIIYLLLVLGADKTYESIHI
jgi:uncharacterized protein YjbI with pentapeptide repeats